MTLDEFLNEDIRKLKPRRKFNVYDLSKHPEDWGPENTEDIDVVKQKAEFFKNFKNFIDNLEKQDFVADAYGFLNEKEIKVLEASIRNLIALKNKISKRIPGAKLEHSMAKKGKFII